MKHISRYKTFESNLGYDWKDIYNEWLEENKDRLTTTFSSGFVKKLEPHYTLDLFKQDLEEQGNWNPEWNVSHTEAWRDAQLTWADNYQRGL